MPIWESGERRAFKFDVADPSATLYCALLDEDSDPFSQDDPIGRCAVALRALAPDTTYDAWLPLALKGSEGEALCGNQSFEDAPIRGELMLFRRHFLDARRGGAERICLVQAGAESITTRPT